MKRDDIAAVFLTRHHVMPLLMRPIRRHDRDRVLLPVMLAGPANCAIRVYRQRRPQNHGIDPRGR
jgi:hypothetical protein